MPHHVPAAHQSEHRLDLILAHARRAAADEGAPVHRRDVALLADIVEAARAVVASADRSADPTTVDADELGRLAALIERSQVPDGDSTGDARP